MRTSKSYASFGRLAVSTDSDSSGQPRHRSSLDKIVIPGRTRIPSVKPPAPTLLDLQLTQCLLNSKSCHTLRPLSGDHKEESTTRARRQHSSESTLSEYQSFIIRSQQKQKLYYEKMVPFIPPRASSCSHSKLFLETPSKWVFHAAPVHIVEFNHRATASGLLPYGEGVKLKAGNVAKEQNDNGGLRHRLSTYSLKIKSYAKPSVSSSNPITRPVQPSAKSVAEMCSLGGVRVLTLPCNFAFDSLPLPTCIQLTAKYIFQHGKNTPRIFELSGRVKTANEIYDRFVKLFKVDDKLGNTEVTVDSDCLPTDIDYTVHEMATTFKRLIRRLPGGLLGPHLFETFRNIIFKFKLQADPAGVHQFNPREGAVLIAMATRCEESLPRIALIWAVLGLAGVVGNETEEAKRRGNTADLTDYRKLGYIFGPLLLGEAYENSLKNLDEVKKHRSDANLIAWVLIASWREVVAAYRSSAFP